MLKFIVPVAALGLFLGYHALDVSIRDSYSGMWNCTTSAQARREGVWHRQYVVEPAELTFQNYKVAFTDCWLEEQTHTRHRWLFFKSVTKMGNTHLILNYQGQRLTADPDSTGGGAMLVPGRHGVGRFLAEYGPAPGGLVQSQFAYLPLSDSIGNDTIYLSIIRRWKDRRNFLVKVYPQQ